MFTISQITEAHSKVRSGADFPMYVQDLIGLGVTKFETFVYDGHSLYFGANEYKTQSDKTYPAIEVSATGDKTQFQNELKKHQQGGTSYQDFCSACARSGVDKWIVDIANMTCTYYDSNGNLILVEPIPIPL